MKRAGLHFATVLLLVSSAAMAQNTITEWNEIGIIAARASTAPGSATAGGTGIYMAYVHLAAYNAVAAIDRRFEPYEYPLTAPAGASADAAVIEASYRTLVYLLPDQADFLTKGYESSLAAIPDGDAKTKGKMLGLASANNLIALRSGDGRLASVPYTFPSVPTPGVWILTPGATAAQTPFIGQMRPFTADSPARFLPEPPPDLGSDKWAHDYNEVKSLGELNSTLRTPEQTQKARFWTDHGASQYGRMLRAIAGHRKLSISDTARLFAMSYTAYADAFIGCVNAKYHYSFWRPVTAIRYADIDGNPDTTPDPNWSPLVTTPNHPEYPSAHGCLTGALAETLAAYFGTRKMPISVDSAITGTSRHFESISDWENEVGNARIYAGFHYRFSVRQGLILGHKVAHNLASHYFRRVGGENDDPENTGPTTSHGDSSPAAAVYENSITVASAEANNAAALIAAISPNITGNWWGTLSNSKFMNGQFGGPIVVSDGVVRQTYFAFNNVQECIFSGKISGTLSGSIFKAKIDGSADPWFPWPVYFKLNGTVLSNYAMKGSYGMVYKSSCDYPSSGIWKLNRVAKVTGTWVGWTKAAGSTTTHSLKLALTQGSKVGLLSAFNQYGSTPPSYIYSSVFQVKGQFGSSGSNCVSSAAAAASDVLDGGVGGLRVNFGTNQPIGVRFYGTLAGIGATQMTGRYRLASGSCKGQAGTFSLSRQ